MVRMGNFNYYDKIAPIYEETRWMTESVSEKVAAFILAFVEATSETSFLEPGVGTGLNVFPLVREGYSVTGIDVSRAMLDQFHKKFNKIPQNLSLIHANASQLPFVDQSFDVVLTVHMVHTISDWKTFLGDIERVLKPKGFYLDARWITPPARMEFENHFRAILSKHEKAQGLSKAAIEKIDLENYFLSKGFRSNHMIVAKWMVRNTVNELLGFFRSRAYGLCWQVSSEIFELVMNDFEKFCARHYGSLQEELSSEAEFEIWAYTTR